MSTLHENTNIIQFPGAKKNASHNLHGKISGIVTSLSQTQKNEYVFLPENDTAPMYMAKKFFEILFSMGRIDIISSSDEVDDRAIVRVEKYSNETYEVWEMPITYFIKVTQKDAHKIDNYEEYLSNLLNPLCIKIGIRVEDSDLIETTLSDSEIDMFHPETIMIERGNGKEYICEIFHEIHVPLGYSDYTDIEEGRVTLLDLILTCIDSAEQDGHNIQGANLDISCSEGYGKKTTHIPGGRVDSMVYSALIRMNPIYQNMSYEHARRHYFQKKIIPRLSIPV